MYNEFESISERGGVLGAMDTMYQRGKIQEESMYYEHKKHDGSLPLIGVKTFLPKEHAGEIETEIELIRSTPDEKASRSITYIPCSKPETRWQGRVLALWRYRRLNAPTHQMTQTAATRPTRAL